MSLQGKNKRTTDTCDWDTQNVEAPVEQNPQIQASSSEQLSMFVELDTLKSMRAKQDRNAADEVQESTCLPALTAPRVLFSGCLGRFGGMS